EKEIDGGNPAVPGNDEISPGVRWRLTRTARDPPDPPAIAQFLGRGNRLISKVGVRRLDRASDAIDLVAATVNTPGLVEHAIFGVDLVDGRAPTHGIVFTEDVIKITGQQGRYAVGHGFVSSAHWETCFGRGRKRADPPTRRWAGFTSRSPRRNVIDSMQGEPRGPGICRPCRIRM